MLYQIPILFNVFNRPEITQQTFNLIRKVQPAVLYVHADGPRVGNDADVDKCARTRAIIEQQVDWNCELHTLFRDENLGCGKGPASAITWFFENVEQGIILEDDCQPHLDFFPFCKEMLERYKDDVRVSSIAGSNFQDGQKRGEASYYFSQHNRIWGWATWRRTWEKYDYYLTDYDAEMFEEILKRHFRRKDERAYWMRNFDIVKATRHNDSCWDYQFMYLQWRYNGLTLVPNVNLVSNVGDDADATHTQWENNPNLRRKVDSLYPLIYTNSVEACKEADEYYMRRYIIPQRSILCRLKNKLLKICGKR